MCSVCQRATAVVTTFLRAGCKNWAETWGVGVFSDALGGKDDPVTIRPAAAASAVVPPGTQN